MARKLAISNTVPVPVTLTVPDANGKRHTHSFTLICKRLSQEELRAAARGGDNADVMLMTKVAEGWKDQRLVLEDDDVPSAFSPEAFADLMSIAGAPGVCVAAYLREVEVRAKN